MNIELKERSLALTFDNDMNFLSWAIVGGGFTRGRKVFWSKVKSDELPRHLSPREVLLRKISEEGIEENIIGFMTSAQLDDYVCITKKLNDFSASTLCTVGMGNALRVGDAGKNYLAIRSVGTINIACSFNRSMTREALLEAMSIIIEARTLAVLEEKIASKVSGLMATGTGTDCVVVAAPVKNNDFDEDIYYSGKHTIVAELIGQSVYQAVRLGIQKWKKRTHYGEDYLGYGGSKERQESICFR